MYRWIQKALFATLILLQLSSSNLGFGYSIEANNKLGLGLPDQTVSFSGDAADAPPAIWSVFNPGGRCSVTAAGAGFSYSHSRTNGVSGLLSGVASTQGAEFNLVDNLNLLNAANSGANTFEFLVHFETKVSTYAPDRPGFGSFDDAQVLLDVNVYGPGFSNSETGFHSLSEGSLESQSGLYVGLPDAGGELDFTVPGSITVTGSGSTINFGIDTWVFTQSRGSGNAGVYVQLADVPITRSDGTTLESLGISHNFIPDPISANGFACNLGFNLWDVAALTINPIVFAGGGNIASANLFGVGDGGFSSVGVFDVDANGEVLAPITTEVVESSTDGLTILGTDLDGNLLLSAPTGTITAGVTLESLFSSWTVAGALDTPENFLLDPTVQAVLLQPIPPMGSTAVLDIELFSFDLFSGVSSVFGGAELYETHAGDFDLDGDVDEVDLQTWESGYGDTPFAAYQDGDSNADGSIDGFDFLIWQRNFGIPLPTVAASASVPEPSTLLLASLSGCTFLQRRRRGYLAEVAPTSASSGVTFLGV